ncbi:uncharacterized protein LOC126735055 [Anthonomus grandis grandis]|uniref:uncharacterized protein LOC126735055 n=1 Tax=Anthonomus grandis grandis TaxID=2921223 RepID=UPI0021652DD7|nr:uncharacterized protein LOC126735055 [Anthonomus grandis grandis]
MPSKLPVAPQCSHHSGALQCKKLTIRDLKAFHEKFYSTYDKLKEFPFILKYTQVLNIKRRRPKNEMHSRKQFHTKYFVSSIERTLIPVCQQTFLNSLNIKSLRVQRAIGNFMKTGTAPQENRGGDYKSKKFKNKCLAVILFLKSLKCDSSHYCRSSSMRQYLSSDLNINKLIRLYNDQAASELKVKHTYFWKIFSTKFILGFEHPVTDACSTCIQLSLKIKSETDVNKKPKLMAEKQVHKYKAKAFFDLVRKKRDDLITFCFDCEKNAPFPKIPDQSCYYSRQLYLYNFTITQGSSKDTLFKNNTFCYVWTEDVHKKGSNEIASALYHRLQNTDFHYKKVIGLVAYGCGGQNKNITVITACSFWFQQKAPQNIETIELVFPITGHSFIPPDRVFGNIEKKIKTFENIVNPDQYKDIISEHGTIIELGSDCIIPDFKAAAETVLKSTSSLHFKITECKRFFIRKSTRKNDILVRREPVYRHNMSLFKSITKKNRLLENFQPAVIRKYGVKVKEEKANDVKKLLLKHFGEQWKLNVELVYFKKFFERNNLGPEDEESRIRCLNFNLN